MPTHLTIANHLDLSVKSVQEFFNKTKLDHKSMTMDAIRIAYIRGLRDKASGRSGDGELDLVQEKARLAIAQTERIEMQNKVTRRDLVPAIWVSHALAAAASKITAVLDTIPGRCKQRSDKLTGEDVKVIEKEIAKARNEIAALSIDDIIESLPVEDDMDIEESDGYVKASVEL